MPEVRPTILSGEAWCLGLQFPRIAPMEEWRMTVSRTTPSEIDSVPRDCQCGHSASSHIYPCPTLSYGDCHECRCELYNPPGGLKDIPIHPLFAFSEDEFRFASCSHCGRFYVLPDGVCEQCGWDNDQNGMVETTRPEYCLHSPTKKHVIPNVTAHLRADYCRYCLRTIDECGVKRRENVKKFWKRTKARSFKTR
jgi:hypothetical protein